MSAAGDVPAYYSQAFFEKQAVEQKERKRELHCEAQRRFQARKSAAKAADGAKAALAVDAPPRGPVWAAGSDSESSGPSWAHLRGDDRRRAQVNDAVKRCRAQRHATRATNWHREPRLSQKERKARAAREYRARQKQRAAEATCAGAACGERGGAGTGELAVPGERAVPGGPGADADGGPDPGPAPTAVPAPAPAPTPAAVPAPAPPISGTTVGHRRSPRGDWRSRSRTPSGGDDDRPEAALEQPLAEAGAGEYQAPGAAAPGGGGGAPPPRRPLAWTRRPRLSRPPLRSSRPRRRRWGRGRHPQ